MTLDDFHKSITATEPPTGLTPALAGLWWDARGDWARAHESAQQDEGRDGSWVHAYEPRKEGDQGNAAYWYNRAGKPACRDTFLALSPVPSGKRYSSEPRPAAREENESVPCGVGY